MAEGPSAARCAVAWDRPEDRARAERLALELDLPPFNPDAPTPYLLAVTPERLELRSRDRAGPIFASFSRHRRLAPGVRGEALLRAAGLRGGYRPRVADATAGLGDDAFLLAATGCEVVMLERSGIVWALLDDGLRRARHDPELRATAERLELKRGEAGRLLPLLAPPPEVVYLDPMYPSSGKTARKRKEMHAFRALLGDDADAPELLAAALAAATARVVLKRPAKGAVLAGPKPSAMIPGKTTRFDVYLTGG